MFVKIERERCNYINNNNKNSIVVEYPSRRGIKNKAFLSDCLIIDALVNNTQLARRINYKFHLFLGYCAIICI